MPGPDRRAVLSPAGAAETLPRLLPQEAAAALWSEGRRTPRSIVEGSAQRTEKTVTLPRGRWEMQRWGYPGAPRLPQRRSEGVCPRAPWSHVLGSQHGLCELRHQLSFGTQGCRTLRVQSEVTGGLWGRGAVRGDRARRPSRTSFRFDFLLRSSIPNQMHYHIFSLITVSGGNSFFLIQLNDWQVEPHKWLRVTLTKIVIVIDVILT